MTDPEASEGRERLDAILRRRRRTRVLRGLALLAVLALAVFLWLGRDAWLPSEPPSPATPVAEAPEAPAPADRPPPTREAPEAEAPEPGAPARSAPLPPLAESDAALREEAAALSGAEVWSRWLDAGSLLERFVLAVVQVSEGSTPRKPLAPLAPSAPYRVRTDEDGRTTPHPASHARYDAIAAAIADIDAEEAAALYRRFEPLLEEVHDRLGFPDAPLRRFLERAAAEILGAPRVVGSPALVFHVNHYRYADPALEELSPARKLVLRTGPENARRIQEKVREIARALGLSERALPDTPTVRVDH